MASPTPGPRTEKVERIEVRSYTLQDGTVRTRTSHLRGTRDISFVDTPPVDPPPPDNQPPTVAFAYVKSGLTVTFDASGSDPEGKPLTYAWEFGDGATSTTEDPAHTYAAGGQYTVKVTVADDKGAKASASTVIELSAPPPPEPTGKAARVDGNAIVIEGKRYKPWILEEYQAKGGDVSGDGGWINYKNVIEGAATMKATGIRFLPFILLGSTNIQSAPFLNASPNGAGYMPPPETRGNDDMNLWQGVGLTQIAATIDRAIAAGIPYVEIALAGGVVEDLYMRPDVKAMLMDPVRHSHIVIHAVGEDYHDNGPVYDPAPPRAWRDHCISVVQKFRAYGYDVPLVCMSNNGGRNARTVLDYAADVLAADPFHNVAFGIQMYWNGTVDQGPANGFLYQQLANRSIRQTINEGAARTDIAIIFGLCGNPGALGNQYPPLFDEYDIAAKANASIAHWDYAAASGAILLSGDRLPPNGGVWNTPETGADPTDGERIVKLFQAHAG